MGPLENIVRTIEELILTIENNGNYKENMVPVSSFRFPVKNLFYSVGRASVPAQPSHTRQPCIFMVRG